jgi:hypothetical protein
MLILALAGGVEEPTVCYQARHVRLLVDDVLACSLTDSGLLSQIMLWPNNGQQEMLPFLLIVQTATTNPSFDIHQPFTDDGLPITAG